MANRSLTLLFLISVSFLLLHVFTFSQFGIQWDEPAHHHLAQATQRFIQGETSTIQLQRENLIFYGSWFDLANHSLGSFLNQSLRIPHIDASHVLIFLAFLVGSGAYFWLTEKLFDQTVAFWSLIFLISMPRLLAHAHYNHKDIPLATFSVLILASLYQTFTQKKYRWAVISGFILGLALAIQVTALLILVIFTISLTSAVLFRDLVLAKKHFWLASVILIVSGLTAWIFWPAAWKDPILPLKAINFFLNHDWQGIVLYLGKFYPAVQTPWHYPLVYLLTTVPLITLLSAGLGVCQVTKLPQKGKPIFPAILIMAWLLVPILADAKPGTLRYDGIRHFLTSFFPLATLAGSGAAWLSKKLIKKFNQFSQNALQTGFLLIITGLLIKESLLVHPYGGVYFNELFRLFVPRHIEKVMDFDYWGLSYREGIGWLNQHAPKNSTICVPLAGHLINHYQARADLNFDCSPQSNYLMFITRYAFLPKEFYSQTSNNQPIFTVTRLNSDLLQVYQLAALEPTPSSP